MAAESSGHYQIIFLALAHWRRDLKPYARKGFIPFKPRAISSSLYGIARRKSGTPDPESQHRPYELNLDIE